MPPRRRPGSLSGRSRRPQQLPPGAASCAAAVTSAPAPSGREGSRPGRSRSPGSARDPLAPDRAARWPAACSRRPMRAALRRRRVAARARPGRASRRCPRGGGRASSRRRRAGASPPGTRRWPGGPAPCGSRARASTSSGRGSGRVRSPCPRRPRGAGCARPAERSFSHGGAWLTSVTRSSKSARSTGVATRSASAVIRRRRFGFSAAHTARNVSSAPLPARPSVNLRAKSARWSNRICRPAIVAQKRCSSSSRNFGSTRCHSRWITASRRATSGVTGTSHGAGESCRRARRCWRRRGAGVTRAPSR